MNLSEDTLNLSEDTLNLINKIRNELDLLRKKPEKKKNIRPINITTKERVNIEIYSIKIFKP